MYTMAEDVTRPRIESSRPYKYASSTHSSYNFRTWQGTSFPASPSLSKPPINSDNGEISIPSC